MCLALVDHVLHLFVLDHDEVLDLLREALEAIDEIRRLIGVINLFELGHRLWLTNPRYDTVLELRVSGELALPLLTIDEIVGPIPSREARLLSYIIGPILQRGATLERREVDLAVRDSLNQWIVAEHVRLLVRFPTTVLKIVRERKTGILELER